MTNTTTSNTNTRTKATTTTQSYAAAPASSITTTTPAVSTGGAVSQSSAQHGEHHAELPQPHGTYPPPPYTHEPELEPPSRRSIDNHIHHEEGPAATAAPPLPNNDVQSGLLVSISHDQTSPHPETPYRTPKANRAEAPTHPPPFLQPQQGDVDEPPSSPLLPPLPPSPLSPSPSLPNPHPETPTNLDSHWIYLAVNEDVASGAAQSETSLHVEDSPAPNDTNNQGDSL